MGCSPLCRARRNCIGWRRGSSRPTCGLRCWRFGRRTGLCGRLRYLPWQAETGQPAGVSCPAWRRTPYDRSADCQPHPSRQGANARLSYDAEAANRFSRSLSCKQRSIRPGGCQFQQYSCSGTSVRKQRSWRFAFPAKLRILPWSGRGRRRDGPGSHPIEARARGCQW